jgi:protein-S-isoprenylcysteine O-methyltransferase Ste14
MWLIARTWPQFAVDFAFRRTAAALLAAAGLDLCVLGVLSFRRAATTVDPTRPERATTLVTSGVYSVSRNPMYLGFVLLLAGWALALASSIALLLCPVYAVYLDRSQIAREERALASAFGDAWTDYARKVRRWF